MICEFDATVFFLGPLDMLMLVRYPPKLIPGCHITVHTTARNDRDARLLMSSMGIPFYGKQIN